MNYLLDTCVFSDFIKKNPSVVKHFEAISPKKIHISTVSVMEIEFGLKLNIEREKKIRPILDALLKEIQILSFSESCARATAHFKSFLQIAGKSIGPFDILIAGTAFAHHLVLVTSNIKEFRRVPGIIIEDWRES